MKISFGLKRSIWKRVRSLRFLKNIILISSIFLLILIGFLVIKHSILSTRKLDLKTYEKLFAEYSVNSNRVFEEEGLVIFEFKKGACTVKSLIYGVDVIEKLEYQITFNASPVKNKRERDRKEEIACLTSGFQKITEAFQTKNTKKEFIKFSKNSLKELRKSDEVTHKFHGKKITVKNENNVLIISIN